MVVTGIVQIDPVIYYKVFNHLFPFLLPVISGYFWSIRSPLLNVMLVVPVPARNKSSVVLLRVSTVNSECLFPFSWGKIWQNVLNDKAKR